jgi:tetratricopeptide (TPR) repeat protein
VSRSSRSFTSAQAAFVALLLALSANHASAEPQMSAVSGQMEERPGKFVSEGTGRRLTQLQELMAEEKFDEAIAGLNALLNKVKDNDYEHAVVLQNLAGAYLSKGKPEDYRQALPLYEKVLTLKVLPVATENSIVYNLAQLYAQIENYAKTTQLLEAWFKVTQNPPATAMILMANAYASQEKWREALPWVEKAIAKNPTPQESWYKLQLAIQYEIKDYKACVATLEIMVANWPGNKKYWEQLVSMYLELEQDSKALAAMAVSHRRGFVTEEKPILNLVRMYLLNEAPYEAGRLLDQSLAAKQVAGTEKTYSLLAQAWLDAREWQKATQALGKGGELAADGELYVRKAQIHVDQLEYTEAIKAVEKAFQKGNLKRPGYAYMIQGRAAAETKNFKAAEEAFRKARGYEDTKKSADSWLSYLGELQQR